VNAAICWHDEASATINWRGGCEEQNAVAEPVLPVTKSKKKGFGQPAMPRGPATAWIFAAGFPSRFNLMLTAYFFTGLLVT
jgi:hypothetical protein